MMVINQKLNRNSFMSLNLITSLLAFSSLLNIRSALLSMHPNIKEQTMDNIQVAVAVKSFLKNY